MGGASGIVRKLVPVLLAGAVLAFWTIAFNGNFTFKQRLQNMVFDAYQQIEPRPHFDGSPILVLDIDEESLAKVGQWPWPRDYMAAITQYLQDLGVAVIAFDVFFSEEDRTSPDIVVERMPAEAKLLLEGLSLPNNDETFAQVLRRGRVVLGQAILHFENEDEDTLPPQHGFGVQSSEPHASSYFPTVLGVTRALSVLEEAASGIGSVSFISDADGVVRTVHSMMNYRGSFQPALAIEALRVAQGLKNYTYKTVGGNAETDLFGTRGITKLRVGDFTIPTDKDGGIRLYYARHGGYEVIPLWKVITGEIDPANFAGRVVLVGSTATGLRDIRFNAHGEDISGVFMHANLIDQILTGAFLVRPHWAPPVENMALIVFSILLIIVVLRFGALWSSILGVIIVSTGATASLYAFLEHKVLIDPLIPSLTALSVFMVCSISRYWQTEKDQRFIRGAFKTFVSPNLVESLAHHPEALRLGGTRKECTFIFTDLAGFTSFVEKSDPEVSVPLLNDYIDNMVRIGLEHGGYLDKIVGDATVFHFNAFLPPLDQPDHRQRAYDCAMAMDAWATAYSEQKKAEGIPLNETRIGINSGPVTMGNFGGAVMDYTAHGDAINTAARLESAGKFLGVQVSLSGATLEGVDNFIGRPCGTLVLKGQTVGTPVYEPMTQDRFDGPAVQQYMKAYGLMEQEDPGALAAMEAVLAFDENDGLAKMHLDRLRDGQNGIRIVMTSK